jgi:hypothetical protein
MITQIWRYKEVNAVIYKSVNCKLGPSPFHEYPIKQYSISTCPIDFQNRHAPNESKT